jgi:hypothetical protein
MGTQSQSFHCNGEVLARGKVIFEAKLFYTPDVVEAWKDQLQKRLSLFGVQLDWQYKNGKFAQLHVLGDDFEAASEEVQGKNTLEQFASTYKRPL